VPHRRDPEELDRVWTEREKRVDEADHDKLKDALHALAAMLVRGAIRRRPARCSTPATKTCRWDPGAGEAGRPGSRNAGG